jgi:hypothetical protein
MRPVGMEPVRSVISGYGREPVRTVQLGFLACIVLGMALAAGCGEDEKEDPFQPPLEFQVREGTWNLELNLRLAGADLCDTTETLEITDVLCAFDPDGDAGVDTVGPLAGIPFTCQGEWVGDEVTFSCSRSRDLEPCRLSEIFRGEGTMTDTTMDLQTTDFYTWTALDPQNQAACDFLAPPFLPCTLWVDLTGDWISSEGDTICQEAGAPSPPMPLEILLTRTSRWRNR